MPLVLSGNDSLLALQPLAEEVQANEPPKLNTYSPQVESWRRDVWDRMPAALKQRPDAATLLDKALYTLNGESGGNERAVGDGGSAWGGWQSHHIPTGSDRNTQIDDMWRLVGKNPDQWTDWGEGALYNGQKFGALGNNPYPNATGGAIAGTTQSLLSGQGGGAPASSSQSRPILNFTQEVPQPNSISVQDTQGLPAITSGATPPSNLRNKLYQERYGTEAPSAGDVSIGMPDNSTDNPLALPFGAYDKLNVDIPLVSEGVRNYVKPALETATNAYMAGAYLASKGAEAVTGQSVPTPGDISSSVLGQGGALDLGLLASQGNEFARAKPNLRVVGPEERPLPSQIKSAVNPHDQYNALRAEGYSDAEIAAAFGEDAVRSGQAGQNLGVAENTARIEAPSNAAKSAYDDAIAAGKSPEEAQRSAKRAAAQTASPSERSTSFEAVIKGWTEQQLLNERRYLEDTIASASVEIKTNPGRAEGLRAAERDLDIVNRELQSRGSAYMPSSDRIKQAVEDAGTPFNNVGASKVYDALSEEADRLSQLGHTSAPSSLIDDITWAAAKLGDPFNELVLPVIRKKGSQLLRQAVEGEQEDRQQSGLQRAIDFAGNPNIPDQPLPPEQLNMLSDVLGQQSFQSAETDFSGVTKPPEGLTLGQQRLNRGLTEPAGFPGEGQIVTDLRKLPPETQTNLLNKDWYPGKSIAESAKSGIADIVSLPRALQTRFDFSYPFRQGLLFIRRQNEFWDAFAKGFRSLWDEDFANAIEREYKNAPYNPQTLKITSWKEGAGLQGREEAFYNRLLDKVPGLRSFFDASERGATVFINKLRSDVANSVARKWLREGLSANDPQFIEDLNRVGNYVNRATGYGNLGDLENAVGALNQVFYGARRNVAMVQAPGYLFNSSARVRIEAWKDFLALFGLGASTLALADIAGIGDVNTFNPASADWGKLKIGNTRLDIWGGYQQLARTVWKIADGQAKNPGDIANIWQTMLPFLGNKLSPQAGAAVSTLPTDIKSHIQPEDRNPFKLDQGLTPLAWQGLVDAIKEDGAIAGAVSVSGLFGTGTQTYESKTDARDKVAQEQFKKDYEELTPTQRGKVDRSDYMQNYNQENQSRYQQTKDRLVKPIQQQEQAAEQAFQRGELTKSLPDTWHELDIQRRQVATDLKDQFAEMFDNFDKTKFDSAVEGYYNIAEKAPDGSLDFDKTEAQRQDYLNKLPEDQRNWVNEALQATQESKSPLHQKYLNYIDARKKAGYFDIPTDDPKRTAKLAQLDVDNPQQDALNWYWKSGVKGQEAPRLNSKAGVDIALQIAPDRPAQLSGFARPVNQSPGSIQAWHDYGQRIDNYLNKSVQVNKEPISQELFGKPYAQLDNKQQGTVASTVLRRTRDGSPELEAALQFFGHDADPNGDYIVSAAAGQYLQQMLAKYGNQPVKMNTPSGRPSKFLVRQ